VDAVIEMHRDHLVSVAVRRTEQIPRVWEQAELPHPLSLARDEITIRHVSESTDHDPRAEVRPDAGVTVVIPQQTRPAQENRVRLRTTNGYEIREIWLSGRNDSNRHSHSGHEARREHQRERANFLSARYRAPLARPAQIAHSMEITGMRRCSKAIFGRRANPSNKRAESPRQWDAQFFRESGNGGSPSRASSRSQSNPARVFEL
jgi:hypothetical protein